jgi:hypothetical protein
VITNESTIGASAFYRCTGLTSIVVFDGVTSIQGVAFSGCSSLRSVVIPDSVTSIGGWAFKDCTNLTNIQFNGTTEQWRKISFDSTWNLHTNNYKITCTNGNIYKN